MASSPPDLKAVEEEEKERFEHGAENSETDEEAYFNNTRYSAKHTMLRQKPTTVLPPINEKHSSASWSKSAHSSIEELNSRGYRHNFKGRRRSIGSQVKLMILEEQR